MRTLDPALQGGLLDSPAPSAGRPNPLGGLLGNMNRLQQASLATSLLPVVPDVLGLAGDVQMYAQNPEERTPLNYGLSALGLLPFIPPIGATVFHGSPHLFDKFSMDKIGTGEGAQAYGHGLYFAENPEVAKDYSRVVSADGGWNVSAAPARAQLSETSFNRIKDTANFAMVESAYFARGPEAAKKEAIRAFDASRGTPYSDAFHELAYKVDWEKSPGHFYTVDLPDEAIDKMLDWDKPLSEQSDKVKAALSPEAMGLRLVKDEDFYGYFDKSGNLVGGAASSPQKLSEQWNLKLQNSTSVGSWYNSMMHPDPKTMSELLNNAGIPGIKYLDQGSRGTGEGTRNFVVFDDNLLNIKSRE